jgi:hypothetical protein
MPKYTVKPEADYPTAMPSSEKKKKRYPTVTIPVSKEIIAALEVDGPVVVELKGFVQKLQSSEASGGDSYDNRTEIRVELRQVEAYPTEAEEEAADAKEPSMKDAIDEGSATRKRNEARNDPGDGAGARRCAASVASRRGAR